MRFKTGLAATVGLALAALIASTVQAGAVPAMVKKHHRHRLHRHPHYETLQPVGNGGHDHVALPIYGTSGHDHVAPLKAVTIGH